MNDEKGNLQGFQVKDRRRFDNEGNERSNELPENASAQQITVQKGVVEKKAVADDIVSTVGTAHNVEEQRFEDQQSTTFSAFVASLATQALMQLGEIPSELPVDREAAKYYIEILSMLRDKTSGNLDAGENRLLEDVLHNLRMAYVKGTIKNQ